MLKKRKGRNNKAKTVKVMSNSKKKAWKGTEKKSNKEFRDQTCLNYTCIDNAIGYLKLLKDKVSNFDKQASRMKRQNKTGKGKAGKKGLFGPVLRRITLVGGGNTSDLTCNGEKNFGASQLNNLTETLLKCEASIK